MRCRLLALLGLLGLVGCEPGRPAVAIATATQAPVATATATVQPTLTATPTTAAVEESATETPVPTSTEPAREEPEFPLDLAGEIQGASFVIKVPENWNGTLLVYAHDYMGIQKVAYPQATILGRTAEKLLLDHGYALAASGFRNTGGLSPEEGLWNVEEGITDSERLALYFEENIASAKHLLIYGEDMGATIALKSMEMGDGVYDGAVPVCAPAAGATRQVDAQLNFTVAYAAALGWEVGCSRTAGWCDIGDLPEGARILVEVRIQPGVTQALGDPANATPLEFVRLVNGLPPGGFYEIDSRYYLGGAYVNMVNGYLRRAALEARTGGPMAQNTDRVYSLSDSDRAYLQGPGMTAAQMDDMLATMNSTTDIEAWSTAREYVAQYGDFTGAIEGPVLMFHNIEDPVTLVQGTTAYAEAVAAQDKTNLLVRVYTDRAGHCNVTPQQMLALFEAMVGWLDMGEAPTAEAFPAELEIVTDFEPDPWPWPGLH